MKILQVKASQLNEESQLQKQHCQGPVLFNLRYSSTQLQPQATVDMNKLS